MSGLRMLEEEEEGSNGASLGLVDGSPGVVHLPRGRSGARAVLRLGVERQGENGPKTGHRARLDSSENVGRVGFDGD
jgi:hypothetical protein